MAPFTAAVHKRLCLILYHKLYHKRAALKIGRLQMQNQGRGLFLVLAGILFGGLVVQQGFH